jgi:hypothetical protein
VILSLLLSLTGGTYDSVRFETSKASEDNEEVQEMNIRYRAIPNLSEPGEYVVLPLLQISLRYGNKGRRFLALVDSGAAGCLFPARWARF